jgi:hypothetical protein
MKSKSKGERQKAKSKSDSIRGISGRHGGWWNGYSSFIGINLRDENPLPFAFCLLPFAF